MVPLHAALSLHLEVVFLWLTKQCYKMFAYHIGHSDMLEASVSVLKIQGSDVRLWQWAACRKYHTIPSPSHVHFCPLWHLLVSTCLPCSEFTSALLFAYLCHLHRPRCFIWFYTHVNRWTKSQILGMTPNVLKKSFVDLILFN